MSDEFEQISLKPGFMKHNGGLLFKTTSEDKYQFKTTIKENHLNAAGITHGGFIAAVVDAGAGTAAHRAAENNQCVTISLELKFSIEYLFSQFSISSFGGFCIIAEFISVPPPTHLPSAYEIITLISGSLA